MDWSNGFADRISRGVPLADRTWFGLGGAARYMFSPRDTDELRSVVDHARCDGIAIRILGGGANLLVRDRGFDGLVIRLDQPAFTTVAYRVDRVDAGAGVDLMKLSRDCSYRGLSGLECMAGIPGTVGGAVTMNAGGKFGQFGDMVETVRLLEQSGELCEVSAAGLEFGYRRSAVGDRIVTGVVLRLKHGSVEQTRQRYLDIWQTKKDSQPMAAHSAGCIFKNPPGDFAGRLIDKAGMKKATHGRARVSEMHGNFIVADDGATSSDVLGLVERVRDRVLAQTGVRLELEIDIW